MGNKAKNAQGADGAGDGAAAAQSKGTPTEIPMGIAQVLPAEGEQGTLIPEIALEFDPRPDAVANALAVPMALTVSWPIAGKAPNLHDLVIPCHLSWQVEYDDKGRPPRGSDAIGKETVLKIDGGGRFQVLVDNKAPVLDLISAGIAGSGSVSFSLALDQPPGAKPQTCPDKVGFNVVCTVTVTTNPASDLHLGDTATYAFNLRDVLKKTEITFSTIEQDAGESHAGGDTEAWTRVFAPGKLSSTCTWTLGFKDEAGSWGTGFSYSEQFEEGDFEYGWELRAKCPSLPPDQKPLVLLSSTEPLKVHKPQLADFHVEAVDYGKGLWRAVGSITGFSPNGPRVRVALKLVDHEGKHHPAEVKDAPKVALEKDGSFKVEILGPKVNAPPAGQPAQQIVFAILSLLPTWESDKKQNPISGFLGYDKDTYALYEDAHKTGWNLSAGWISSKESLGIAPRPPEPRAGGGGGFTAPGPSAGDPQDSALTLDEIVADLVASEWEVPYMYLDSNAYMTVGIGTCIVPGDKKKKENRMDPKIALTLPFKNVDTGEEPAKPEDIRTAYANVAKMPKGLFPPDKYRTHPHLELDPKTIRSLVKTYIDNATKDLRTYLPGFDQFPKAARRAILDISYNRGTGHFGPKKNYKIRQAALNRDWKKAADETPKDGQQSRRQWRMDLFAYAQAFEDSKKKKEPTS